MHLIQSRVKQVEIINTLGGNLKSPKYMEDLTTIAIPYPTLRIKRRPESILDYAYEDFEVLDYQHHPAIKAPVAV